VSLTVCRLESMRRSVHAENRVVKISLKIVILGILCMWCQKTPKNTVVVVVLKRKVQHDGSLLGVQNALEVILEAHVLEDLKTDVVEELVAAVGGDMAMVGVVGEDG
jgi:hypothetical protein